MSRTLPRLYFAEEEVAEIARPILADHFAPFGFRRVDVQEETDWDGQPSLKVQAVTDEWVPAGVLNAATAALNVALLRLGDKRFAYLHAELSGPGHKEPRVA